MFYDLCIRTLQFQANPSPISQFSKKHWSFISSLASIDEALGQFVSESSIGRQNQTRICPR